jgi:hypothetical protein
MAILTRSGQKADVTGNITSNNNKEITAAVHRAVLDNLIDSAKFRKNDLPVPFSSTSGTTAYTATISNDYPAAYTTNFLFLLKIGNTSTGNATLNLNSLGSLDWKNVNGVQFTTGQLVAGDYHLVLYDGTDFISLFTKATATKTFENVSSLTYTLGTNGIFNFTGSNNATWTLPAGSAGIVGQEITVFNDTSFELTIAPDGSDTFTSFFGGIVYGGSYYTFTWTGTKWITI